MDPPGFHPALLYAAGLFLVVLVAFLALLRQHRRDPGKGLLADLNKGLVLTAFAASLTVVGGLVISAPESSGEPKPTPPGGPAPDSGPPVPSPPSGDGPSREPPRSRTWGVCGDVEGDPELPARPTTSARVRVTVDGSLAATDRDYLRARLTTVLGREAALDGAAVHVTDSRIEERGSSVPTAYVSLDWTLRGPSGDALSSSEGTSGRGNTLEVARRNALACAAAEVASRIRARAGPGA